MKAPGRSRWRRCAGVGTGRSRGGLAAGEPVEDSGADQLGILEGRSREAGMHLARQRVEGLSGAVKTLADDDVEERVAHAQGLQRVCSRDLVAGGGSGRNILGLGEPERHRIRAIQQLRRQECKPVCQVGRGSKSSKPARHPAGGGQQRVAAGRRVDAWRRRDVNRPARKRRGATNGELVVLACGVDVDRESRAD